MPRGKHLTPQQQADIASSYRRGISVESIAASLGITPRYVYEVAGKLGLRRVKRLTEEDRSTIIRLYQDGISSEKIALQIGTSGVSVRNCLQKAGVGRRASSEARRWEEKPRSFGSPPWVYTDFEKACSSFHRLKNLNVSEALTPMIKGYGTATVPYYIKKMRVGMYASHYFHERLRMGISVGRAPSPLAVWEANRDAIQQAADEGRHSSLRAAWTAMSRPAWGFSPSVAKAVFAHFRASRVLDPCAGWGDRLVGALAYGCSYVGVDPNRKMSDIYTRIINNYQLDSESTEKRVITGAFEDVSVDGTFDLVFTSPPYYSWERYSDDPEQSCHRYKSPAAWRTGFLQSLVEKSFAALCSGGHLAINISEVPDPETRERLPLPDWLCEDAQAAGFRSAGLLIMNTGNHDRNNEGIFIYRKP